LLEMSVHDGPGAGYLFTLQSHHDHRNFDGKIDTV
jgi:hypothetical protein